MSVNYWEIGSDKRAAIINANVKLTIQLCSIRKLSALPLLLKVPCIIIDGMSIAKQLFCYCK